MKRLLRILLIASLVIAAAYYLAIDNLIKSAIESQASRALKAQVNIANAHFHLLGRSVSLDGVQITNPQAPLRNLMQADNVTLTLNIADLLAHKIVADEVRIRGLRLDQARSDSGAIEGLTPEAAPPSAPAAQTPTLAGTFTVENAGANGAWQQRLQTLADNSIVDRLREQARQARESRSAIAVTQFRQALQAQLSQLQQLRDNLNRDAQHAQQELANARTLSDSELSRQVTNHGVAGTQLALRLKDLLSRLPVAAVAGGDGQWTLLARRVVLDGEYELGAKPLRLEADIANVAAIPGAADEPMTFRFNGAADQPGKISGSGSFDPRNGSGQLNYTLDQVPVAGLPLDGESGVNLLLDTALASGSGQITLRDHQIDLKLNHRFQQAALTPVTADQATAQALGNALRGITDFGLDIEASGATSNPVVTVRSDIARQLGNSRLRADLERAQQLLAARERALNELAREL